MKRSSYISALNSYLEPIPLYQSKVSRNEELYLSLRESLCKSSQDALDEYVSLLLVLKLIQKERVLSKAATSVLCKVLSCLTSLDQYNCFQYMLFNMSHLPPSQCVNMGLKFELLHYSVSNNNHVLSLRCATFQELEAEPLRPVVGHFMCGYFDRAVGVSFQAKRRICSNPGLTVSWIVSVPQRAEDGLNGLRNDILKEKWNSFYDDCDWCTKKTSSADYLDYLIRVTNAKSEGGRVKLLRRCSSDVDDVVFMKFSDKDSKGYHVPLMYSAFLVGFLLLIAFSFCALRFFFPLIRFL